MATNDDLLGIGLPDFTPYKTDDGWTVVLPGEEDGRRGNRKLYAVTHVGIRLDGRDNLDKCLRHLEESDRRLRLMGDRMWDWQKVKIKDVEVSFGVAWYDESFFKSRKDAWTSPEHVKLYEAFGATAKNFTVRHEIV